MYIYIYKSRSNVKERVREFNKKARKIQVVALRGYFAEKGREHKEIQTYLCKPQSHKRWSFFTVILKKISNLM